MQTSGMAVLTAQLQLNISMVPQKTRTSGVSILINKKTVCQAHTVFLYRSRCVRP